MPAESGETLGLSQAPREIVAVPKGLALLIVSAAFSLLGAGGIGAWKASVGIEVMARDQVKAEERAAEDRRADLAFRAEVNAKLEKLKDSAAASVADRFTAAQAQAHEDREDQKIEALEARILRRLDSLERERK